MADVKVPSKLGSMSPTFQKAWYKRNNMPLPPHLTGSVKQASKEVKPSERVKALQTKSIQAYGATKGTKVGGEHGSGEMKDTVKPLTRDQWSKIDAAKRAAKAAEKAKRPVIKSKEDRLSFLKGAFAKAKSPERAKRFDVPTLDKEHENLRRDNDLMHSVGVRHSYNEGYDPSSAEIAKMLVDKHGPNVTKDHIKELEDERDTHGGLDHEEIMKHVKKMTEEVKLDEGNKENKAKKNEYVANIIKKKLNPVVLPSLKFGRRELKKEEAEQVDEANMRFDYEAAARPKSSDVKNFLNRDKNARAAAASKKYIRRMTKLGGLGPNQTKKDTEAHMKAHFEEVELDEASVNDREYASRDLMHPNMAKIMKPGENVDFYSHDTSKLSGMVTKNDGKFVHIKADPHHGGKLHMFKVQPHLPKTVKVEEVEFNESVLPGTENPLENKMMDIATTRVTSAGTKMPKSIAQQMAKRALNATKPHPIAQLRGEETVVEEKDEQEYGYEGDMAMSQLKSIISNAQKLHDMLEPDTDLPEWVQSKITLAEDYIVTAANYCESDLDEEVEQTDEAAADWKRAFGAVATKNLNKDVGAMRSKTSRLRFVGMQPSVDTTPKVTAATTKKGTYSEEVEQIDEDHEDTYHKHMNAHIDAANAGKWDKAEMHAQKAEAAAAKHFKATGKKIKDIGYTGDSPHIVGSGMKEEVEQVDEKYMGFKAVMAAAKKGGARDPAAVAAAIGRKKYGKEKFQAMAAAGKKKANEEVEGSVPTTPKEKELAAHHGDPNRITFGDVLKARLKSAAAKKMGK